MTKSEYTISAKLAAEVLEVLIAASQDDTGEYNNDDVIRVREAFTQALIEQEEKP